MKILFWDSESNAINDFVDQAQSLVELVSFEDISEMLELVDQEQPKAVLLDYDANKKLVEKEVKKLKKVANVPKIILLSNILNPKQLAKHQSSKVGADIYFRTPLSLRQIELIFSSFFNLKLDSSTASELSQEITNPEAETQPRERAVLRSMPDLPDLEDEEEEVMEHLSDEAQDLSDEDKSFQEKILNEHLATESIPDQVQEISNELDQTFKAVFPESENELKASEALAGFDETTDEVSLDDEVGLDEGLSLDDNTAELSLDDEDLDTVLPDDDDLAFPDDGDLAFPDDISSSIDSKKEDIEKKTLNEEPDMSGHDENDLSLDGMADLEISSDSNQTQQGQEEEEGMELDLSSNDSLDIGDSSESAGLVAQVDDGSLDFEDSGVEIELGGDEDIESIDVLSDELDLSADIKEITVDSSAQVMPVEDSIDLGSDDENLDLGSDDESLDLGSDDENLDLGSEDESLDLGSEDESLDLGSEDESLGLGSDDESLDLGSEDESLGLGSDDNHVDADSLNIDMGEDLSVADEEIEFGVTESHPTEESSIPEEVEDIDLSFNTNAGLPLKEKDTGLSADALEKLAEIDKMMMESTYEDSVEEINATQINDDLIAANSDDDTTVTEVESLDLSNELDHFEDTVEDIDTDSSEYLQKPQVTKKQSTINSNILQDHQDIKGHHSDELMRLGETIKNLQEDREQLLSRVKDLEAIQDDKKRSSVSMKAELDEKKIEIAILRKRYAQQIEDMKIQLDISNEKKEILSEKNKQFESEYEKLNRKIRVDLNKVRARERELENKLEMLRSDADIQIRNRDHKILELKRKIDTLEFDNESIQSQGQKIVSNKHELEGKMEKVIQTLRLAIGELEDDNSMVRAVKDVKKNLDV